MHEFFLTQCLIEEVEFALNSQQANDQITNRVTKVAVGFGPFTHASFDSIKFWWNTSLEGTSLEGALLVKEQVDGKLFCPNCNKEFIIKESNNQDYNEYLELFACPECNSCQTQIKEGTDILLLNIEFEIEVIE